MKIFAFLILDLSVVDLVWHLAFGRHDASATQDRLVVTAVAARRLSAGTTLAAEDLSVALERVARNARTIADPKTAIAWRLTQDVEPGEVLTESMISPTAPFDSPRQPCVLLTLPTAGGVWRGTLPQRGSTARVWMQGEARNPVVQYARVLGLSTADTEEQYIQLEVLPATANRIAALAKSDSKFWATAAPIPPATSTPTPQRRRGRPAPPEPPCERPPAD